VNGFALGGGCELALACDWIYASSKARFGQPEVNLGLLPGFGGTSRMVRRVGIAWANELVLAGEPIDAETALRIGLVEEVVEKGAALERALALAESAARQSPPAVAACKDLIQRAREGDIAAAYASERESFVRLFDTRDQTEGVRAFLEKRKPVWKNA
jgi:enoyl-CoA hydratase/carnithine racemase